MGSLKRTISVVLGIAAGLALTAFVVSKTGQKEIKKFGSLTADLREELLSSVAKDITKIKRVSKEFI